MSAHNSHQNIYCDTVGCRANQADTASLVHALRSEGAVIVPRMDGAHVVFIHTCCVTAEALADCRSRIRKALAQDQVRRVVVTGCGTRELAPFCKELGDDRVRIAGDGGTAPADVAAWWTAGASGHVPTTVRDRTYGYFDKVVAAQQPGRTRAVLKVQNGCTHYCTYCIVPYVRGPERSMSRRRAVEQAVELERAGVREIVLSGVQLGAWGKDLSGGETISDLVSSLADALRTARLRLSSIEPWSVTPQLVALVASHPRICSHLHVPLQSGDDNVLQDMRRGYTVRAYMEAVRPFRELAPHGCLGTDVICGFPTETEDAFARTLEVVEEVGFSYVHAFSYSTRKGTVAARKWKQGNRKQAKERTARLRAVADSLHRRFVAAQGGRRSQVLVEEADWGLTDTFVRVKVDAAPQGSLVDCILVPENDGLRAVVSAEDARGYGGSQSGAV